MFDLDSILPLVTKPARYTGNEWNSVKKDWYKTDVRMVLAYPDAYEIGMSNLGLAILYDLINKAENILVERVYAPWVDMEEQMRKTGIPLFSLESKHPVKEFDIFGFSLGHELTYTNVLNMLDLAGIPVLADNRDESHPLVIAGGICALNPEPMADFIDIFVIGEGEEVVFELLELYREWKLADKPGGKTGLLRKAARIEGIYVPSLYRVDYHSDGVVRSITPLTKEAKPVIKRRILAELPPLPDRLIVPYIQTVHDRAPVEIQRGCVQGCRFCQAGMIYRPLRHRSQEIIVDNVGKLIDNCGFDEVSLLSLSSSDYQGIDELVGKLLEKYNDRHITLSLPSLRMDSFTLELAEALNIKRKSSFTFAPEAGNESLRKAINKKLTDESLVKTCEMILERGWTNLKFYFMIGLPSEKLSDVEDILNLVWKIRSLRTATARRLTLKVNAATFIPKPHTPFQWVGQNRAEELQPKHEILQKGFRKMGVAFSWHDTQSSLLEAALSRGDRRIGKVIHRAWQSGSIFNSWSEHFKYETWNQAFIDCGVDPAFYANRERSMDETLPWYHIDIGVTQEFLKEEYRLSTGRKESDSCQYGACSTCGLERWIDGCGGK